MLLIKISKFLAALVALGLVVNTLMLAFLFAAFGQLNLFYGNFAVLYLLVCVLTLRAVFVRRTNHTSTGLEFTVYGMLVALGWFAIGQFALLPAGLFILCGMLALIGAKLPQKPEPQRPY